MKLRIKITALVLLMVSSFSYGQIEEYSYKHEIRGISGQWHKIILPDEVFGKISQDFSDIRIFGITEQNDTIEAPYLLRSETANISDNEVKFKIINTSHNKDGYYFTFEIPETEPINQINLDFSKKNFDWRIKLEGSQNQTDWFTIIDNYRILSIKNEITDFQFTKLIFPDSEYRYFRLLIISNEKPELASVSLLQQEISDGTYRNYSIRKSVVKENRKSRLTEIDLQLEISVPVSQLKIYVKDTFDFYRPVTIKYLADSVKTEQGWQYNYRTLASGTLNSLEENIFQFSRTTVQKLKIFIHNQANQALTIDSVEVKGEVHELVARFTEQATYYLVYGNQAAARPNYDIGYFVDKVPETLSSLTLGNELKIEKEETQLTPLFKNKIWLWLIISAIIFLLGWFTLKMIRKD